MIIKSKVSSQAQEWEVTDQQVYLNRRQFMKASLATVAGASVAGNIFAATETSSLVVPSQFAEAFSNIKPSSYGAGEVVAPFDVATGYNNFYEFGFGKEDPAERAHLLKPTPWSIEVQGEANNLGKFHLEDLIKEAALEERIYRLRCVEGWSMVIPWVGIPMATFLNRFAPNSNAKYVYFETLYDPEQMPGQKGRGLDWPYREALTIEEAMHPLAFIAVGMYGAILANQNGAPIRIVIPWKYGFKSIKSIVKIRFTEQRPMTTWNRMAPHEYGFYANVNPNVDHPRWSQARERRLPSGVFLPNIIETKLFNGYDEVASLYSGIDLSKNY